MSTISIRPATAGGAIGVAGTPSSLRFRPTAATESGNRRASRLGGNGLTTCSAAKFKSSASAPSESGSGRRPRVSPLSKSVASSASWAVGSSNYKNPPPHTRVPTRATRGASRYSLLPERSLIKDVNGAAVCLGVSKPGRGSSERAANSAPPNSDVLRGLLNHLSPKREEEIQRRGEGPRAGEATHRRSSNARLRRERRQPLRRTRDRPRGRPGTVCARTPCLSPFRYHPCPEHRGVYQDSADFHPPKLAAALRRHGAPVWFKLPMAPARNSILVDILEDEPTGVSKPTRQGKCLSEIGLLAMKGCGEAGDLRNLRSNILDCGNGRKVVRLMKRRQWREPRKVVEDKACPNPAHTIVTSV